MTSYLITGGAGFIGSNLVEELCRRREAVRVLDNFITGRRENLSGLENKIELIEGDLRDFDTVRKAASGVDFILHQGALPSVPFSVDDPVTTNEINVGGTLNVLIAAREAEVKRVVIASSSAVYGDTPALPKEEGMATRPLSPYAVSKLTAEQYGCAFHGVYGLETVALRYFNVFGPRQDPASRYAAVIPIFIKAFLKNESPTIFGDGEQSRDFAYVDNVVAANLLATTAPDAAGGVYNIGSGERRTLNELVEHLKKIIDTDSEAINAPPRPGDIMHSWADISLAKEKLGFEPLTGFVDGLEKTVNWYKEQAG
ncbi:MAG: SDR family oxidoreductase [Planctomycetota bacterium]|nr:MAG: SDR family oxidoreductase [Planctomycetota bacterium]